MKKLLLLTLIMILAVPAVAQAWRGCGGPYGGPYGGAWEEGNFSADQQASLEKIMEEYQNKANALYSDLTTKEMELEYLSQNAKTDPKTISTLIQEIKILREKTLELRQKTAATLQKDLGLRRHHAQAMMGARAGGPGWGCPGPGFGPGNWRNRF